jgi:DNA repair ATPase RecN
MPADKALHQALDQLPQHILDGLPSAAEDLGITSAQWLTEVLHAALSAQRAAEIDPGKPMPPSWLETVSRQEQLVAIAEVTESQNVAGENLGSLKDELEQIRQLVQDYMRVVEPVLAPIQTLPDRVQELSMLAENVRESADAAQRAANSVRPLERTLLRLAGDGNREEPEGRDGARAAGIGRLFRR